MVVAADAPLGSGVTAAAATSMLVVSRSAPPTLASSEDAQERVLAELAKLKAFLEV